MRHLLLVLLLLAIARPLSAQLACCARVTAIDPRTGVVSATAAPGGTTFQFEVKDRVLLARLRINQQIYADFRARTVGVDARQACCTMLGGGPAPTAGRPAGAGGPAAPDPAADPRSRAPAGATTGPAPGAAGVPNVAAAAVPAISLTKPSIALGTPFVRSTSRGGDTKPPRVEQRTITAMVGGRSRSTSVLHLRGKRAVEEAPGLPDGARRLLLMHIGTVPRDQSDHYIVNVALAEEWVRTHPVPDYVKPSKPPKPDCDNWYDSFDCAGQAASDEWDRAWRRATSAWSDATSRLADEWKTVQGCFADDVISLPDIPIRFGITPSMTVDLEQSGGRGAARGSVKGSATLGVPMTGDFRGQLDLFYIPCLPFAIRPRSLSADGTMRVGEELSATLTASGSFERTFTIPPTGGPVIPIQVFPIVIAGVPVAEMDVSAYIEGQIEVRAEGRAEGRFTMGHANTTTFAFTCSGKGCSGRPRGTSAPVTTGESAQLTGRVTVRPAIYTALQLNFNYEALSARAGPQPFLQGLATGCTSVAATQTAGAPTSSSEHHVLTADLDWGAELRAEALVMREVMGNPFVTPLMQERHLWYRDLAPGGSTGLAPEMDLAPAQAAKPAVVSVRMSTCYPYTERVQVRLTWDGNATPAQHRQCRWGTRDGVCDIVPGQDIQVALLWPQSGTFSVTAAIVSDAHQRTFSSVPPTRRTVTVVP